MFGIGGLLCELGDSSRYTTVPVRFVTFVGPSILKEESDNGEGGPLSLHELDHGISSLMDPEFDDVSVFQECLQCSGGGTGDRDDVCGT